MTEQDAAGADETRPDTRQQPTRRPKPQHLNPETAAKKLGILLAAAPEEFRTADLTRDDVTALQDEPPQWLVDLRRDGPHPKQVVAAKLGVSTSGLARAGATEPMTTDEIQALLEDRPEWLAQERATQAAVREEQVRVKNEKAGRAALRADRDASGREKR